jgi:F0F1-type ATP synthase delta subunit
VYDYEIDSSILGGVLIIDGDKYYDGTLKSQLIKLRKALN